MTYAQWLAMAEMYSLKERKEREERDDLIRQIYKAYMRGMREMLIRLLGLNIGAGKAQDQEDEVIPYIPFISIVAKPEVMQELLRMEEDGEVSNEVLNDANLDALNEQLMNLDLGDLEPLLETNTKRKWTEVDTKEAMKALGIAPDGPLMPTDRR